MIKQAQDLGADAVIKMRFMTSAIMGGLDSLLTSLPGFSFLRIQSR